MAASFDELIERLLYDVALSGDAGFSYQECGSAVKNFYDEKDKLTGRQNVNDAQSLLFCDAPPSTGSFIDEAFIRSVWDWLIDHSEVTVRKAIHPAGDIHDEPTVAPKSGTDIDDTHNIENAQPSIGEPNLADLRLHTGEDRVWYALTGHGVDNKRIPKLEFGCLSVIAAKGAKGILQPEVTKLTGQDKRSVPKRTDALAEKGYIVKESVLGHGTKTSLLKLKRYASTKTTSDQSLVSGSSLVGPEGRIVHYDHWFDATMRLLEDNDNVIALEDLRIGLGVTGLRWETKNLFRCLRRLEKGGCVRKITATVDDETPGDEGSTKHWLRCIQLLRPPTDVDRHKFKGTPSNSRKVIASHAEIATRETVDDEGEDDDVEDDDLDLLEKRIPPQWDPKLPLVNFLFDLINARDIEGCASMDLNARACGPHWRRPLDETMLRLTDKWHQSQPPHLRHLTIIKDTDVRGRNTYFKYRSIENFEKAVQNGDASWEAIPHSSSSTKGKKKKGVQPTGPDLDDWGFPKLPPKLFTNRDGRATLQACRKAASQDTIASMQAEHGSGSTPRPLNGSPSKPTAASRFPSSAISFYGSSRGLPPGGMEAFPKARRGRPPKKQKSNSIIGPESPSTERSKDAGAPNGKKRTATTALLDAPSRLAKAVRLDNDDSDQAESATRSPAAGMGEKVGPGSIVSGTQSAFAPINGTVAPVGPLVIIPPQDKGHLESLLSSTIQPTESDTEMDDTASVLPLLHCQVQINTPRALQLKKDSVKQRGRPRKALIAVIRSTQLSLFDWFVEDRHPDLFASRKAPSRKESVLLPTVDPPKPADERSSDEETSIPVSISHSQAPTPVPELSITPVGTPVQYGATFVGTDGALATLPRPRMIAHASPLLEPQIDRPSSHDLRNPSDHNQGTLINGSQGDIVQPTHGSIVEAPMPARDENRASAYHAPESNSETQPPQDGEPMSLNLQEAVVEDEVSTENSKQRKKAGMGRGEGGTKFFRNKIILDLIDRCGGAFPGNGELYAPFLEDWRKKTKNTPDRSTLSNATKQLVASRKLKRLVFTFRSSKGTIVERAIITRPDLDPSAEVVRLMQTRMIEMHPQHYLPEEAAVVKEDLRIMHRMPPSGHKGDESSTGLVKTWTTLPRHYIRHDFPEDKTVIVKRSAVAMAKLDEIAKLQGFRDEVHRRSTYATPLSNRRYYSEQAYTASKATTKGSALYVDDISSDDEGLWDDQLPFMEEFQLDSYVWGPLEARSSENGVVNPIAVEPDEPAIISGRERAKWNRLERLWQLHSCELLMSSIQPFHEPSGTFGSTGVGVSGRAKLHALQGSLSKMSLSRHLHDEATASFNKFHNDVNRVQKLEVRYMDGDQGIVNIADDGFVNLFVSPIQPKPRMKSREISRLRPLGARSPGLLTNALSLGSAKSLRTRAPFKQQAMQTQFKASLGSGGAHIVEDSSVAQPAPTRRKYKSRKRKNITDATEDADPAVDEDADGTPPINYERRVEQFQQVYGQPDADNTEQRGYSSHITGGQGTGAKPLGMVRDRRAVKEFHKTETMITAIAIVKNLCGGLDQHHTWHIIAHAMSFRWQPEFLRHRWEKIRATRSGSVFKRQELLRGLFLEAYENQELPQIHFDDLGQTNWPAILHWAEDAVSSMEAFVGSQVPDLPGSLSELHASYVTSESNSYFDFPKEEYFNGPSDVGRRKVAFGLTFGTQLPRAIRSNSTQNGEQPLLRSVVRAIAITRPHQYNVNEATQKLEQFDPRQVRDVINDLKAEKILKVLNKGRQKPGRNYEIHDNTLVQFRRWPGKTDEYRYLRAVAAARDSIVARFSQCDALELSAHTTDPEMLVLTNMVSQGHLRLTVKLPARNDDFEAPYPRLSALGYTDYKHNSKKIDKSRLRFPVFYERTEAFMSQHGLVPNVPIPQQPRLFDQEREHRIPFWVDIHGNLIEEVWDMVLRSVLHLVVFRPGCTAMEIEASHKARIWTWEIEMILEWMERVGITTRFGREVFEQGMWKGGWRVSEWWYCAYLPEIATWKMPSAQQ